MGTFFSVNCRFIVMPHEMDQLQGLRGCLVLPERNYCSFFNFIQLIECCLMVMDCA